MRSDPQNTLVYGGWIITNVRTLEWDYGSIYNGPDYVMTKYRWSMSGQINLDKQDGTAAGNVKAGKGGLAALMDLIKVSMMTPRTALKYTQGGGTEKSQIVLVVDPATAKGSKPTAAGEAQMFDCNNGPLPVACQVTPILGTRTWCIRWVVEWWAFDPKLAKTSALASNRWSRSTSIDSRGFATIITNGRAAFRPGFLQLYSSGVSNYLQWCLLQVPLGFRRFTTNLDLSQDNQVLMYQLVDVQQVIMPEDPSTAYIAVEETIETSEPNLETRAKVLHDASGELMTLNPVKAAHAAAGFAMAVNSLLPRTKISCHVTAWGTPTAQMQTLSQAVLNIMSNQIDRWKTWGCGETSSLTFSFDKLIVSGHIVADTSPLLFQFKTDGILRLPQIVVDDAILKGGIKKGYTRASSSKKRTKVAPSGALQTSPVTTGEGYQLGVAYLPAVNLFIQALQDQTYYPDSAGQSFRNRKNFGSVPAQYDLTEVNK